MKNHASNCADPARMSKDSLMFWCNSFHHATDARSRNLMKATDPEFIDLLVSAEFFAKEEFEILDSMIPF